MNDYDWKKIYNLRHIEIIREFDPELPDVLCEKLKLQQVLLNLMKNSAYALMHKNEKNDNLKIILRTYKSGRMVTVEIEDNGPGMEKKIQKRIF